MNKELLNQLSDATEFLDGLQQRTSSLKVKKAKIKDLNAAISRKKEALDEFKAKADTGTDLFTTSEILKFYLPSILSFLFFWPIVLFVFIFQHRKFKKVKEAKRQEMLNSYPVKEKEYSDFKEECNAKIADIQAEIDETSKEANCFIAENGHYVAFLPQKYRLNPHAVEYMCSLVSNMRADTLKEAINLYESELREMKFRQEISDKLEEMEHNRSLEAEYFASALKDSRIYQESINENLIEIRDRLKYQ